MKRYAMLIGLLLVVSMEHAHSAAPPSRRAELPADSVLQLPGALTDQSGRKFRLGTRRGAVQLVGMFYSNCQFVCPMLIETGQSIDRALGEQERGRLRVLLISLDPARDTPAALARVAGEHRIDLKRWTLARTDEQTVRRLAAVLDIRYRRLESGEFNHTSALILLDADGRVLARTESLGSKPEPQFIAAVRSALISR